MSVYQRLKKKKKKTKVCKNLKVIKQKPLIKICDIVKNKKIVKPPLKLKPNLKLNSMENIEKENYATASPINNSNGNLISKILKDNNNINYQKTRNEKNASIGYFNNTKQKIVKIILILL